jgi:hypothetical protein
MPRYLYLIAGDESMLDSATPEDWDKMLQAHNDWQKSVEAAGATMTHGDALHPSGTATTIRHGADGAPTVTDGPFAETKEAIGGYYILDCPDFDVALGLAKSLPGEVVELRPVMDLPG